MRLSASEIFLIVICVVLLIACSIRVYMNLNCSDLIIDMPEDSQAAEYSSYLFEVFESAEEAELININTADASLLCTLPGIGENTAENIISYRNEHGKFFRIQDIMKVPGISKNKFEQLKECITAD